MNVYQDIFDIISTYIYGGVELSSHMELVAVTLSTIGCVFVFAIPFIVVWRIIKMLVR